MRIGKKGNGSSTTEEPQKMTERGERTWRQNVKLHVDNNVGDGFGIVLCIFEYLLLCW